MTETYMSYLGLITMLVIQFYFILKCLKATEGGIIKALEGGEDDQRTVTKDS